MNHLMQSLFIAILLCCIGPSIMAETSSQTLERAEFFKKRYEPWLQTNNHLMAKIIDSNGTGAPGLVGNRNVRTVLHGVLYRGGTAESLNPEYDPKNPPLTQDTQARMCQEGFQRAVYLYDAVLSREPIFCSSENAKNGVLQYTSEVAVAVTKERKAIPNPLVIRQLLISTKMSIEGAIDAPLYIHCWTGRHASGFLSALALKQFCDFTSEEAIDYWNEGTDGSSNFPSFHEEIRNFQPYSDLKIDTDTQKALCPQNPYHRAL